MLSLDPPKLEPGNAFTSGSSYRLIERLGRGGMGEVWKAERVSAAGHSHIVAVKFLTEHGGSAGSLAVEALRMSKLSHDNIVPFIDSGVDAGGRFFVAMAFVEGMDLDGLRNMVGMGSEATYAGRATHRIPDQLVGFITFMTLRALRYAHTYDFGNGVVGLVHRDVSPGNILLDEGRGFVKLSDFGVAAVQGADEAQSQIAGKVPYMAPEVLLGDGVDARSDVYALGLVTYELLTGLNPNIRPTVMNSVIGSITEVMLSLDRPLRLPCEVVRGVSPHLSEIVVQMLERDPAKRYQSADAALADMSVFLFDRGFGPTTGSLESYCALIRNPAMKVTERTRQTLSFLDWRAERDAYLPPWRATDVTVEAIRKGENPCRGGE